MDIQTALTILNSIEKKKPASTSKYHYRINKFYCSQEDYDLLQLHCEKTGYKKSKIFSKLIQEFIQAQMNLG